MSYCVNCGVELDKSAKKCVLCNTKVINPNKINKIEENEIKPPFAEQEHVPKSVQQQFIAYIISMVFLITNLVFVLSNLLFFKNNFWSISVASTTFLIWIVFVFPFFTSKLKPYLMWSFDTAAISLYTFLIFKVFSFDLKLYSYAVLPYILIGSISILAYMIWSKSKKRHWLLRLMFTIGIVAVTTLFGGAIATISSFGNEFINFGIIISSSCAAIIGFLIYCYASKRMRKWLSEKFFI